MEEYRSTLALSFFFKFYLSVAQQMKNGPVIPPSYLSALWPLTTDKTVVSKQVYESTNQIVGK